MVSLYLVVTVSPRTPLTDMRRTCENLRERPSSAETLRPPSKTLMLLEGRRAVHELGAFFGALPLLSLAARS